MSKLKGIGVLLIILVIIALPFVSLFKGYNGSVYVENNYERANDNLVNLNNTVVEIEKIKVNDENDIDVKEKNEEEQEYVYEIFKNDVPLNLLVDSDTTNSTDNIFVNIDEKNNAVVNEKEVVKNLNMVIDNDDVIIIDGIDEITLPGESILINSAILDVDTVVISSDTSIINDNKVNFYNINDNIVPLNNTFNSYAKYEYPAWILGEQSSNTLPEAIIDIKQPSYDYSVQVFENENTVIDVVMGVGEVENIESNSYNVFSTQTVETTDETTVISVEMTNDNEIITSEKISIESEEVPLALDITYFEYIVKSKNDEVRQFMNMMGITTDDKNVIHDEVIPEANGEMSSNFNTNLDINIIYDVSSNLTTYELPLYYIDYIDGIPCEQVSKFIVVK